MRARRVDTCSICNEPWSEGAEIGRWLGAMAHQGCKAREAARIASEGRVTALPTYREAIEHWDSRRQVTATKGHGHRRPRKVR